MMWAKGITRHCTWALEWDLHNLRRENKIENKKERKGLI